MLLSRKSRYFYFLFRELGKKYTRFFVLGMILGVICVLIASRILPVIQQRWMTTTIRIGIVGEFTPSTIPESIQRMISFGLTEINTDGSVINGLAKSWEATDSGKTYIFHLDELAVWHSGKPVIAADINYNINNVKFQAPDNTTLIAKLDTAYAPFPIIVAKPILKNGLIGFGEYKVASLQFKGDQLTYLRLTTRTTSQKPAYEYRFYRTENQAITAYELGEIDEIKELTSDDIAVKSWSNTLITKTNPYNRIVSVYFNMNDQTLKEKGIRQALAYAIPDFPYEKALSPLAKTSWGHTDTVHRYSYDADQVKKLLDAAKVEAKSLNLTISTFPQYFEIAKQIAASWNDLGITTVVKVETSVPDNFQVIVSAHDLPADPDQYLLWHSTRTQTNITGYNNAKVDKLLEDGRQETDQEKRKKLYVDFQKRIMEDIPFIPLYHPQVVTVTRKSK